MLYYVVEVDNFFMVNCFLYECYVDVDVMIFDEIILLYIVVGRGMEFIVVLLLVVGVDLRMINYEGELLLDVVILF